VPQVILAIDAGSHSIKLAKAERALGEFQVTEFHEIPLTISEVLTREQATTALLTRFFEEHPIYYDTALASLSGLHTSFRMLDFPFTQSKKIESALEFELENYVPLPIEDLLTDYVVVDKVENLSKVLAVYTPKVEFVKFLNMLSHANCEPRYVGVESLDLANLYHSGLLPPEGNYVILDLGHSKTNLVLMQGPHLRAVRTLSIGGKTITQAIAKAFQIDFNQAEAMKIKQGQVSAFENLISFPRCYKRWSMTFGADSPNLVRLS
jgi:Tfp pilus assembly PilM family ATPase